MSLKTDLAEGVVVTLASWRRANPDASGTDYADRLQRLIEDAIQRYAVATATSRGTIEQSYRDDRALLDWLCGDWVTRASRVHAEILLDPESGTKAAMRRAMAAEREVAA